jgi:hypothetical protein
VLNSGASADPARKTVFSDDVSYLAMTSGPRARIRFSMVGTATSMCARCSAIAARMLSALKRRSRTAWLDSDSPTVQAPKPVLWNSGDAMTAVPCRGKSIRSAISALASGDTLVRGAPLGRPVVPLVRMMKPPGFSGIGSGTVVGSVAISSSTVSTPSGRS